MASLTQPAELPSTLALSPSSRDDAASPQCLLRDNVSARDRLQASPANRQQRLPSSLPNSSSPKPGRPWWQLTTPQPRSPRHYEAPSVLDAPEASLPSVVKPVLQPPSATDTIVSLLSRYGNGNIAVNWRLFFDRERDLSFQAFCGVLHSLGYNKDALALWQDLELSTSHRIPLEMVDPYGSKLIKEFSSWCIRSAGGPRQVFEAADVIGAGVLSRQELVAGLRWLGLFDEKGLPSELRNEAEFLDQLYPIIDPHGKGSVDEDSFMFFEQSGARRPCVQKSVTQTSASESSRRARPKAEQRPPPAPSAALNMLSHLTRKPKLGTEMHSYLQRMEDLRPDADQIEALSRRPPQKPRRKHKKLAVTRSASTPELSIVPPPASQDAAEAAAAVMGAKALQSSVSLPRLTPGRNMPGSRSGAGSRSGGDAAGSEMGFSIAASSVAANRRGMRRLYKTKLEEKLPAVKSAPYSQNRDLRAALTGANCHRRPMDAAMNPQRCEDILSQNFERALFERYYS